MASGKLDREQGIQEGWTRDTDDEIGADGYNAFIAITTRDGTSGFQVFNDIGAVVFSSKSDGDGYFAKDLTVENKTSTFRLQVSNGAVTNYVLTSDAQGNATWQPVSDTAADLYDLENAVRTILKDLDGYHPDITGQEHYHQHSDAIQTILKDLDGYASGQTVSEHYKQHSEAIQTILKDLDGYIWEDDHRPLDELVHLISEDSFEEATYVAGNKVSSMIIWTDSGKTTKIREEQYTYDSLNRVTQILSIQYNPLGIEKERMTEDFTYDGIRVTSITRDVTIA